MTKRNPLALHLTWVARITGLLLFLFVLPFAFGGPGWIQWSRLSGKEQLGLIAFGALYGGLLVAWFQPVWGGALTVGGWIAHPVAAPLFLAPMLIGIIHLVFRRPEGPVPRWLRLVLAGPLPVFVLLSANEILGNPPLMATFPADPTGVWMLDRRCAPPCEIRIDRDRTVTGCVSGRIEPNRSWFGRLLNWRTDYRIGATVLINQEQLRPVNGS